MAAATGRTPLEVAYDAMLEDEGRALLYLPILNYSSGSLEPAREMLLHPRAALGLADGGAHCGVICDASHAHVHAHALDPGPQPGRARCRSSGW